MPPTLGKKSGKMVKKMSTNQIPASTRGQCSCQGAEAQSASALWLDLGITGKHLRQALAPIGDPQNP